MKEIISDLRDENAALQGRLEGRGNLKWDTRRKLYFAHNNPDPYCPACFDRETRQIRLQPVGGHGGNIFRWDCKVCGSYFLVIR